MASKDPTLENSAPENLAPIEAWLVGPMQPVVAESVFRLRAAAGVRRVALMPDVHLANVVCVGAVVATEGVLYPQAVGGDIGCGMAALALDVDARAIDNERAAASILSGLYAGVPSNKHRQAAPLPDSIRPEGLSDPSLGKFALRDGAVQLGTLGGGNHFLELQRDQSGRLWVMLHSGSRGMGQAIAAHHMPHGVPDATGLITLDGGSDAGRAYLADVGWGQRYAAENRLAMLRAVETLFADRFGVAADWETLIHCDHNHVRQETHDGVQLYVHRKGAQSAREDEPGIVPGSMGTASFHTLGRGCAAALASCSHGAGRRYSRSEARRRVTSKEFRQQTAGLWFDHRRAGRLRDEAPAAYNDIRRVMKAQHELTKAVRELVPVLSYKGA